MSNLCSTEDLKNWKPLDLKCLKCKAGDNQERDITFITNESNLKPIKYDLDNTPVDFSKYRTLGIEIEYIE